MQPCLGFLVVGVCEERRIGMWAILRNIAKALFEKPQCCHDFRMCFYWTARRRFSCRNGAALVVEESEPQIICVFVFVPILKRKDLEDGVRENVRHPHRYPRQASNHRGARPRFRVR
jgi:hypothetical protein